MKQITKQSHAELIAAAVRVYLNAQAQESPIVSTTHYTLIRLVKELAEFGVSKEAFYAALDEVYRREQ